MAKASTGKGAAAMPIRAANTADIPQLAAIHAVSGIESDWKAEALIEHLSQLGTYAYVAEEAKIRGFILCRVAADEAEILTFAVLPEARRRGLGRALMDAAVEEAQDRGARAVFLEVAADNAAAIKLYLSAGFVQVGLRAAYYQNGQDALVFRRDLS